MNALIRPLRKMLSRWSRQQETALTKLARGKTFGKRLAGLGASERVDAKYLILAFVVFIPLMLSDELGLDRGLAWYSWAAISAVWYGFVAIMSFAGYFRHYSRGPREEKQNTPED